MDDTKIFIIGANGQLGTALRTRYPGAKHADSMDLDITNKQAVEEHDWSGIEIIINAAAYTNVDGAETADGRILAWSVNADGLANLVAVSAHYNMLLVHISTDYVFDGSQQNHIEDEAFSPLSVYGASKAAGDIAVSLAPKFYIVRTSWVIGEGNNFVRTMLDLGHNGTNPTVVADQVGRPTFTSEVVRAIDHLLSKQPPYGTYNVSGDGDPVSWSEFARQVFEVAGLSAITVSDTTTAEYYAGKPSTAQRPLNSVLNMDKLHATGFTSTQWADDLKTYITKELDVKGATT